MEMKSNCILLKSSPYRIVDDKTGEVNEGVSLRYIPFENLNPVQDELNPDNKGTETVKVSVPYSQLKNIKEVPALYSFTFKMTVDKDRKQVVKPVALEFLHTLSVSPSKQ